MKFFLKVLFIVNILIFFYALFKSEIIHGGTSRETYFTYYFINAILLITILLAIIYKRKLNNNLILTIISSCVFSFYLAEGYISYFNFLDNHEVNKIFHNILSFVFARGIFLLFLTICSSANLSIQDNNLGKPLSCWWRRRCTHSPAGKTYVRGSGTACRCW